VSAAYLIRGNRWGRRSAPATAAAAGRDVGPRSHAATQQGEVREREHATLPAQVHAQRRLLHPPPTAQCTACLLSHLLLPPQLLPLPPLPPSPVPQGGCTAAAAVAVQYAPLYKPGLRCVARSSPGGGLGRCCSPCIATRPARPGGGRQTAFVRACCRQEAAGWTESARLAKMMLHQENPTLLKGRETQRRSSSHTQ
jgi:hypothetical protein